MGNCGFRCNAGRAEVQQETDKRASKISDIRASRASTRSKKIIAERQKSISRRRITTQK